VGYFSQAGHEVHVISPHPDDVLNATTHHPTGKNFDPMKASGWQYLIMIHRVKKLIRKINPDIVHAHYLTSNGMLAAMTGFKPLIVSARGSDVEFSMNNFIKRGVLKYVCKKACLINTVSNVLTDKLIGLGVNRNKLLTLPQGIEVERFIPVYQCDVIIHAIRKLSDKGVNFKLIFAASGTLESELRELAAKLNISSKIVFMGGYKLKQLPQILARGGIYVSASCSDGTSPCLLEAMAAGLFPVVSDIPANRGWLNDETDGMFFPVGDVDALAKCLEKAVNSRDLRENAIKFNQQKVLEKGDRAKNMAVLHENYERLIRSGSKVR
jgi:glycosyltransferase involved in cell wall biosynthesis